VSMRKCFIRCLVMAGGCMMSLLAAQAPLVEILYPPGGSLLDRLCTSDFKRSVNYEAVSAAVRLRPEFQKQWDTDGHVYLNTAFAEIGLDFPYREMQATLTVCLPASTSIPLIIDVVPFLPTATKRAPDCAACQFLLAAELDNCIFLGDLGVGMAGDLHPCLRPVGTPRDAASRTVRSEGGQERATCSISATPASPSCARKYAERRG
jgi:hypothetical protein